MSTAQPQPILPTLTTNWWALPLRGIAAVPFGLAALFWPGLTLFALIAFLEASTLVDGIFAIVAATRGSASRRWLLLAEGVVGLLVGLIALFWRGMTALVYLYIVAAWAILAGILKVHGHLAAAGDRQRVDDGPERLAVGAPRRGPDRPAGCRTAFPGLAHRSIRPRSGADAAVFGFQGARTVGRRQRRGHLVQRLVASSRRVVLR